MESVGKIKIKRFHLTLLPRVVEILQNTDEFRGESSSNIERTLHQRFRYGKWMNRIERCLKGRSLIPLFTDSYDLVAFIAEENENEVVGVVIAYPTKDDIWLLHQIAVLPSYRRKGIGYQLMKSMISHIESRGARKIQLYVKPDNSPAIKLYEKLGFTITDQSVSMTMDLQKKV